METRKVSFELTNVEAKEWVKQGGYLKELALRAFTEEELKNRWEEIKSFSDLERLGLLTTQDKIGTPIDPVMRKEYELQLCRKYMNGYEEKSPRLESQSVFVPQITVVKPESSDEKYMLSASDRFTPLGMFKAWRMDGKDETEYSLFATDSIRYTGSYLGTYKTLPIDGFFFGCRGREIADHFSKYFGRTMFEVMAQRAFMKYEWIIPNPERI